MRCGIEFEYLMVETGRAGPLRILDFETLDYSAISALLADKPGTDDPTLATGDLGIKRGYWYLEGDERFFPDGRFRTLMVKGVEIRTPPEDGVVAAVDRLLGIETALAEVLAVHGLGLAVAGFNPQRAAYTFDPPLNPWEQDLRRAHRAYDGSQISTLSYGPDINLSFPGWSSEAVLDAARKLNHYAPWMVPFSFSSPFFNGRRWAGWSKRTHERARFRPSVKLFLEPEAFARYAAQSRLVYPTRLPSESGRIEFKAFDAHPSADLLTACCALLQGVCLAHDLPARSETVEVARYQRAALAGFDAPDIHAGATELLFKARKALRQHGYSELALRLAPLERLAAERRTPAHDLAIHARDTGLMVLPGGHAQRLAQVAPGV